jgi:hypothetical protein
MAVVHVGDSDTGKSGAVNSYGEVVIPPVYDWIEPFEDGYALVRNNHRVGFVDTRGAFAAAVMYDRAVYAGQEGGIPYFWVEQDGQWEIIPTVFKRDFSEGSVPERLAGWFAEQIEGVREYSDTLNMGVSIVLLIAALEIAVIYVYSFVTTIKTGLLKKEFGRLNGYFTRSGFVHANETARKSFKTLANKKWVGGISGVAYKIGCFKSENKFLLFVISLPYIPLAVAGAAELVIRTVIGIVSTVLITIVHYAFLFVAMWIAFLLIIIFKAIDSGNRKVVRCSASGCMVVAEHRLPNFACPKCGVRHIDLVPGRLGVLFSRCKCGYLLPSCILSGRSKLTAYCPKCAAPLVTTNAAKFAIQLIGGTSAGKTSYLAAFQHVYRQAENKPRVVPDDLFAELERNYQSGHAFESTSGRGIISYSFVHSFSRADDFQFDIFDVPGEVITNGTYETQPEAFKFCEGLVFMIDPLSVTEVRSECESAGDNETLAENYSTDNIDQTFELFINEYKRLRGLSANQIDSTPVAVVISKADVKVVKRDLESGEGERSYLYDTLKLNRLVDNIETSFNKVEFFAVSAMGHSAALDTPYEPIGVTEPIAWLAAQAKAKNRELLDKSAQL